MLKIRQLSPITLIFFYIIINEGWEFGGHADAAAKASDKGGELSGKEDIHEGIDGRIRLGTSGNRYRHKILERP